MTPRAPPSDPVRPGGEASVSKVVFNHILEALFTRALGNRLTSKGRRRLKEIGVDLEAKLLPAYDFETWMRSLEIAATDAFPAQPLPEAMRQLGELLVDGYRGTVMGGAVLGLIRILGPKRTLRRTAQNFRSGNNYTEARLSELSPHQFELWMNEVGPYPQFTAGIILAGLRAAGARDARVEPLEHDGHACVFAIRWNE